MDWGLSSLFLPELALLGTALSLFVVTTTVGGGDHADPKRAGAIADRVAFFGAVFAALLALVPAEGSLFFDAYAVGGFSQTVKFLLCIGLAGSAWLSRGAAQGHVMVRDRPEFHLFLTLATFGMAMLTSATELVGFYVGLELSAYCLYLLVAMTRREGDHAEAALKYFVQGATLSAVSLFGMSILFGLAGTTSIAGIGGAVTADPSLLALAAVVLTLLGVLFKLAVFPFHFWAPDVYEVSNDGAGSFIAAASKVGAIAALLRLLTLGLGHDGLFWILGGLAVASMTYGNLAALVQKDLKRLLAYSGVAQGGYLLMGLMGRDEAAWSAALYYGGAYLALLLLCFIVVVEVGRGREDARLPISAVNGLYRRSPMLAMVLLVGLLGLAGVPPTAGFTGKWLLFKAALDGGAFWLILVAGINNTIAIYYYLIVLKAAYVDDVVDPEPLRTSPLGPRLGVAISLVIVILGVFPQWVMPKLLDAVAAIL